MLHVTSLRALNSSTLSSKPPPSTPRRKEKMEYFNSLLICALELSVFFNKGCNSRLNSVLNDLYDCHRFSKRTRTGGSIEMPRPQVNLLGADTLDRLTRFLPRRVWETAFMSRTIVVYSGGSPEPENPLVSESSFNLPSLAPLAKLNGRLKCTDEFQEEFWDNWFDLPNAGKPKPLHPCLEGYRRRRAEHALKLSMVAAASSCSMTLKAEHAARARMWLEEAEATSEDLFLALRTGGHDY